MEALGNEYRARFDTYLDLLERLDRAALVEHVLRERRSMVEFLNTAEQRRLDDGPERAGPATL